MAAPIVALACDGAFYDVATLEERWGWSAWQYTSDFHARVFAMRCAGLGEVDARLRAGDRPTEARLLEHEMLPLAPCDTERAAFYAVELGGEDPRLAPRDGRSVVGSGQPVSIFGSAAGLRVEVGLAAFVAEELEGADAGEAGRALLGWCLVLDWRLAGGLRWGPSQLGPWITTSLAADRLGSLEAMVTVAGEVRPVRPIPRPFFHPHELVAFASHHVSLRPGDVVGLGAVGRFRAGFGDRVRFEVRGLGRIEGWAAAAAPRPDWRLKSGR